jgi:hypothetical protein
MAQRVARRVEPASIKLMECSFSLEPLYHMQAASDARGSIDDREEKPPFSDLNVLPTTSTGNSPQEIFVTKRPILR